MRFTPVRPTRRRRERRKRPKRRHYTIHVLICLVILISLSQLSCAQEDEGDEFVRQVLQEEEEHYETTHTTEPDSHTEQARLEAEAFQKAQEEQIARERAEQIRLQREAEFEAELARMNEEQQKAAKKQKKKDAKIVRQILNADRKRRLYAVLGVKNYDIHIGPWTILNTDSATIKRGYRTRARAVHPDRNRDGRAQEAFIAVENAASILSDEAQRQVYDEEVRLKRQQQRNKMKQAANTVKNSIGKYINRVTWVFRRIFGPFATPIFILGCLMA